MAPFALYARANESERVTEVAWLTFTQTNLASRRPLSDLRHIFAPLRVSGGGALKIIGHLLGHSQMQITRRYAHLMESPLRAGVATQAHGIKRRAPGVGRISSDPKSDRNPPLFDRP